MIDQVNVSARQIASTGAAESKKVLPKAAMATTALPAENATADLSALSFKLAVSGMAKTPNINIEAVDRIKEAIEHFKYPVDLEQVADHLMESFLDSKR
jgi:negative regulator of flagellin synthesis FlgM